MEDKKAKDHPNIFTTLPAELLTEVLGKLDHRDLVNASRVSKEWHACAMESPVEGSSARLKHLREAMGAEPTLGGFHGSMKSSARKLYEGSPEAMTSDGILGSGFYMELLRSDAGGKPDVERAQAGALKQRPEQPLEPEVAYPVFVNELTDMYGGAEADGRWGGGEAGIEDLGMVYPRTYDKDIKHSPFTALDSNERQNVEPNRLYDEHRARARVQVVPPNYKAQRFDPDFLDGIATRVRRDHRKQRSKETSG